MFTATHTLHLLGYGRHAGLLLFVLSLCVTAGAQDAPEYRLELGASAGLAAYQGDLNGNLLRGQKPAFGLLARYKLNPRMAFALHIDHSRLSGSSDNVDTWMPAIAGQTYDFKSSVTGADVAFEYNCWPFGTGREYFGARHFTPFVTFGAGLVFAKATPALNGRQSVAAFETPFGLGVKYKVADRLNLIAAWTMHFSGTDRIDGLDDPYGIESSGLFKNTDCYSTFRLSLSYDLWAKCRACHNDDE